MLSLRTLPFPDILDLLRRGSSKHRPPQPEGPYEEKHPAGEENHREEHLISRREGGAARCGLSQRSNGGPQPADRE